MSSTEYTTVGYAVHSRVAGVIATYPDMASAIAKVQAENAGCIAQGGYGDRSTYDVDTEGYLRKPGGAYVYQGGDKSRGAVRVTLPIPA